LHKCFSRGVDFVGDNVAKLEFVPVSSKHAATYHGWQEHDCYATDFQRRTDQKSARRIDDRRTVNKPGTSCRCHVTSSAASQQVAG